MKKLVKGFMWLLGLLSVKIKLEQKSKFKDKFLWVFHTWSFYTGDIGKRVGIRIMGIGLYLTLVR